MYYTVKKIRICTSEIVKAFVGGCGGAKRRPTKEMNQSTDAGGWAVHESSVIIAYRITVRSGTGIAWWAGLVGGARISGWMYSPIWAAGGPWSVWLYGLRYRIPYHVAVSAEH